MPGCIHKTTGKRKMWQRQDDPAECILCHQMCVPEVKGLKKKRVITRLLSAAAGITNLWISRLISPAFQGRRLWNIIQWFLICVVSNGVLWASEYIYRRHFLVWVGLSDSGSQIDLYHSAEAQMQWVLAVLLNK